MRTFISGLVVGSMLLGAGVVYAKCGDAAGDEDAVKSARSQVATDCNCANPQPNGTHGDFVKCAADITKTRSSLDPMDPNFLPKQCKGIVKKCAAKSTCGKPGFVTCCFTTTKGPKCKTQKDATTCANKGGTATVDPSNTSCCSTTAPLTKDACNASPSGAFLE